LKLSLDCHFFHADLGCLLLTTDLCNKGVALRLGETEESLAPDKWFMKLLCSNWHLDLGYVFLAARWLKLLGLSCSIGMAVMSESMFFSFDCDFTCIAPFHEVVLYSMPQFPKSSCAISIVSSTD
jgi:hypothetical protein